MNKYTEDDLREELKTKEYEYGFYTDIASDTFPNGLNEDIVRAISLKKEEPQWMTDWRLEAFKAWKEMVEPEWANVHYQKPDFQAISYYSAPNKKPKYEEYVDLYSKITQLEKTCILSAHGDVENHQWYFYSKDKGYPIQNFIDEVDGKYKLIILNSCNPAAYSISSKKTPVLMFNQDFSHRNSEQGLGQVELFVPEYGYIDSYVLDWEIEQLKEFLKK